MTAVLPAPRAAQPLLLPAGGAVHPAPARRRRRPVRAALRFTARWSLRMAVSTAVLAVLGLAVGPHVLDYRTAIMATDSMAPSIDRGDVVVSTPIALADVREGMVITYRIPVGDRRVVTHRVVEVERGPGGTVTVRTQGDANRMPDPWTAQLRGDTAYAMQAVVPGVGDLAGVLNSPPVRTLLVQMAPVFLSVVLLIAIWRPTRHLDAEDAPAATRAG
ncbi:signal peptidase I [Blastococcus sp. SYSU D00820]